MDGGGGDRQRGAAARDHRVALRAFRLASGRLPADEDDRRAAQPVRRPRRRVGEVTAMGDLLLVRHGETEWSLSGRHTSWTDLPLTQRGEEQAKSLAPLLAGRTFALALTSPLGR